MESESGDSKEEQMEHERLRQEAVRQSERERREKYRRQEEEREQVILSNSKSKFNIQRFVINPIIFSCS